MHNLLKQHLWAVSNSWQWEGLKMLMHIFWRLLDLLINWPEGEISWAYNQFQALRELDLLCAYKPLKRNIFSAIMCTWACLYAWKQCWWPAEQVSSAAACSISLNGFEGEWEFDNISRSNKTKPFFKFFGNYLFDCGFRSSQPHVIKTCVLWLHLWKCNKTMTRLTSKDWNLPFWKWPVYFSNGGFENVG